MNRIINVMMTVAGILRNVMERSVPSGTVGHLNAGNTHAGVLLFRSYMFNVIRHRKVTDIPPGTEKKN